MMNRKGQSFSVWFSALELCAFEEQRNSDFVAMLFSADDVCGTQIAKIMTDTPFIEMQRPPKFNQIIEKTNAFIKEYETAPASLQDWFCKFAAFASAEMEKGD